MVISNNGMAKIEDLSDFSFNYNLWGRGFSLKCFIFLIKGLILSLGKFPPVLSLTIVSSFLVMVLGWFGRWKSNLTPKVGC